ncbi:unnamed protein product [Moneuplotes crassus]|uniref:Cyclic nucleotide-binding domain-containing protein n=2 Tax=Euplotes crassus TaxID=5936 RepID=A0AAD1XA07_EUPCR|nr:unnamed protein product [Moneuplotes crassus]
MAKNTYGISNEIYINYNKGDILLHVDDLDTYFKGPQIQFIILKGKAKVYFDKPGAKFTPIKLLKSGTPEDLGIDRLDPISFGELDHFGDFRKMLEKNTTVKEFYCIATEKSRIIKCSPDKCEDYLRIVRSSHYQMEQLEFLSKAIPGLDKISAAARNKVSSCFKERTFMPRMKLISEGKINDYAYIIKSGTCALVSSKNPLSRRISAAEKAIKLISIKGYISETTSTFQLGLCGTYDWVGEDILILNDLPFPFSIIAKTQVVALRISKHDLFNRIPYEFKNNLEEQSKNRNKWLQNRVKAITNTSQIIYRQDPKQGVYDTVMNQLVSQYPQATSNAVKSFTRHHISMTGAENRGKIIKSVSMNHRKSEAPVLTNRRKRCIFTSSYGTQAPKTSHKRRVSYFRKDKKMLPLAASFSGVQRMYTKAAKARKNHYINPY